MPEAGYTKSRNVIDAIISLCKLEDLSVKNVGQSKNRINGMGGPFECFGKKLFAGAMNKSPNECSRLLEKEFSYSGQQNRPPDAMIRGGDAIEFKKVESWDSTSLQLNSSFPKRSLTSDSSFISQKCRGVETWTEKDIIYAVGVVKKSLLKRMWMVYGTDFCDDSSEYLNLRNPLEEVAREKVESQGYVMDLKSKEPVRVTGKIDHLDVTRFRLRAIWEIASPWVVFNAQYTSSLEKHEERFGHRNFEFVALINDEKWKALGNADKLYELIKNGMTGLGVYEVTISNPNRPQDKRGAKMVIYTR